MVLAGFFALVGVATFVTFLRSAVFLAGISALSVGWAAGLGAFFAYFAAALSSLLTVTCVSVTLALSTLG